LHIKSAAMKRHCPSGRRPAGWSRRGFTLIEMLSVMVIIALLTAIIVSGMSVATRKSDVNRARADLEKLRKVIDDYKLNNGAYPGSLPGAPGVTNDPWGQPYHYAMPGAATPSLYDLWSFGPNGANDSGKGDDISN